MVTVLGSRTQSELVDPIRGLFVQEKRLATVAHCLSRAGHCCSVLCLFRA